MLHNRTGCLYEAYPQTDVYWADITLDSEHLYRTFIFNLCKQLFQYTKMYSPWEVSAEAWDLLTEVLKHSEVLGRLIRHRAWIILSRCVKTCLTHCWFNLQKTSRTETSSNTTLWHQKRCVQETYADLRYACFPLKKQWESAGRQAGGRSVCPLSRNPSQ